MKVFVHFLRVKKDWRATSPPLQALNTSDKNFEIDILLKIVQIFDNKNSGVDTAPQGPGVGAVSYALGAYMVVMEGMLV